MPTFRFKAFDAAGRSHSGTLEALSHEFALASMHQRGLFPAELREAEARDERNWWSMELLTRRRELPSAELAALTRELATMLSASLPVDEVLRVASLQPLLARDVRETIVRLLDDVAQGAALNEALARSGRFPEFYCRLVQAGETSGELPRVLTDLAAYLERTEEVRQKIRTAMAYPAFLLVSSIVSALVVAAVLLPTIAPMFEEAGRRPPWLIGVLLSLHHTSNENWPLVLILIASAVLGPVVIMRLPRARVPWQRLLLGLPLIGRLKGHAAIARFTRTLSIMLGSRVPMLDALTAAAHAQGNPAYLQALTEASERVSMGEGLAAALQTSGLFTELSLRLVSTGERTAQLEVMLARVADIYDASLQRDLSRVTTMAAPVITLLIGVLVGGLMLSVIQALLSVNEMALR